MTGRFDPVAVVETAYDLEGEDEAWLERLVMVSQPYFGTGQPMIAYTFDRAEVSHVGMQTLVVSGPPEFRRMTESMNLTAPPGGAELALDASYGALTTLSERLADADPSYREHLTQHTGPGGARDFLGVLAISGNDRGAVLGKPLAVQSTPSSSDKTRWEMVAAHIGAGLRLRDRLASPSLDDDTVEAIFDRDRKCIDARGLGERRDARERLREAVERMERARGELRTRDPEAALELWKGLVDGRWSLVEHIDTDGARFVVARRNPIDQPDPRALTQRERQIARLVALGIQNRVIAYRLGLSESLVSMALHSALRKLGLDSRTDIGLAMMSGRARGVARIDVDLEDEKLGALRLPHADVSAFAMLTEAEGEVAELVARGCTNAEIAARRGTSVRTVANQMRSIFSKLEVHSRVALTALIRGLRSG